MSLVLHPQNSFTVVRQIANHTDAATYYVRAVIRNAYTDAIIETLDLTSRGSQRFSKNWQVSADSSGQGFYVSIVTSVYTDSGYTTKSENYGDEETTYLVQDRLLASMRGGGGIDAYTVRRIIREELDKEPKPEAFDYERIPKPQEMKDRTDEILEAVKRVEAKEPEKVDLAPVLSAVGEVKAAVEEKAVTPETDLAPAISAIQDLNKENSVDFQELKDSLIAFEETVVSQVQTTINRALGETEFTSTFSTRAQPKKSQPSEEEAPDIAGLTL